MKGLTPELRAYHAIKLLKDTPGARFTVFVDAESEPDEALNIVIVIRGVGVSQLRVPAFTSITTIGSSDDESLTLQ